MLRVIMLMLAAALLGSLGACSDSSAPEQPSPAVSGIVTDADGNPVANVAVVLDLDFVAHEPAAAEKPRTMIAFELPAPGRYEMRITDACDDEVFLTVRDSATAGEVRIIWDGVDEDGLLLVEGFYHAHFQADGHEPVRLDLALARNLEAEAGEFGLVDCATVRQTWRVAAWTDAQGRYRIERDCWEFGQETTAVDESGTVIGSMVVAPNVRVWAYPADGEHGAPGAWVEFDPVTGAEADVQLP